MTDISKLKAEAEETQHTLACRLSSMLPVNFTKYCADLAFEIVDAAVKQIALQVAEKEAEAHKYEEDRRKAALMTLSDEVKVSIIPQVIAEQCRYMPDLPATIADDGTDKPLFDREQDILAAAQYDHIGTAIARKVAKNEDGWIKWEGGECPVDEDVRVTVKTRSGNILTDGYQRWQWERRNDDRDIIAYRIITPAADRVEE